MQRLTENWKGATAESAVRAVASTNGGGGLGTWEHDLPRILKWGTSSFVKSGGLIFSCANFASILRSVMSYVSLMYVCALCTDNKVACNGAGLACLIFALNSFL